VYYNRPLTVLIENSDLLISYRSGQYLLNIIKLLEKWGYIASASLCRSQQNGLPHHRIRTYLIGIHSDCGGHAFTFPDAIETLSLTQLLGPRCADDDETRRPPGGNPIIAVDIAHERHALLTAPLDDWVVNTHYSLRWILKSSRPTPHVPSLTFSQSSTPWIGSRGRRMTLQEVSRAQGIRSSLFKWPSAKGASLSLLGNTMTASIIHRIAVRLMSCLGYNGISDAWQTGTAQDAIVADALSSSPSPEAQRQDTLTRWLTHH
jgi:hypothetical protein